MKSQLERGVMPDWRLQGLHFLLWEGAAPVFQLAATGLYVKCWADRSPGIDCLFLDRSQQAEIETRHLQQYAGVVTTTLRRLREPR